VPAQPSSGAAYHRLPIDHVLPHSILIAPQRSEHRPCPRVDLHSPICYHAHHDLSDQHPSARSRLPRVKQTHLLPSLFAPCLTLRPSTQMCDILHHPSYRPTEEHVVFLRSSAPFLPPAFRLLTLYIVITCRDQDPYRCLARPLTMNSSVCRGGSYSLCRKVYLSS